MPTDSSNATDGAVEQSSEDLCQPLIALVTKDVYYRNPFRVLGLPVEASTRTIAKRVDTLRILADLGQVEPATRAFAPRSKRSVDDIRAADRALHEPAQRLVHELFWFWPVAGAGGAPDLGLDALERGDSTAAERYWESIAQSPTEGVIAHHNLAVRWHMAALGVERQYDAAKPNDKTSELLYKCWVLALTHWNAIAHKPELWNVMASRVLALDDDRLSLDLVQSMRTALPQALLRINANIVLARSEVGDSVAWKRQLALVLKGGLRGVRPRVFTGWIVDSVKERLRRRVAAAESNQEGGDAASDRRADELVDAAGKYADLIDALSKSGDDPTTCEILDEVAERCRRYAVAYWHSTGNNQRLVDVLSGVLSIARGDPTRQAIESDIRAGRKFICRARLEPVGETLRTINESKASPKERLASFRSSVEARVPALLMSVQESTEVQNELLDAIASTLRGVSVDAWNSGKDGATAVDALDRADKYGIDPEIKKRLAEDRVALRGFMDAQRKERTALRWKQGLWGAVGLFLLLSWAGVFDSPKRNAEPPAPQLPAGSNPSDQAASERTYTVPHSRSAELEQDKAAAATAEADAARIGRQVAAARAALDQKQSEARNAETEVARLGSDIDLRRVTTRSDDSFAVQQFNADVARYNRLLAQAKRLTAAGNALVDPYNTLLARYNAKHQQANQLIDAYNAKLERYGH